MRKLLKSGLCVLLCMLVVIAGVPAQAFAAAKDKDDADKPKAITNADGSTPVSDEWEQAYPYGVFAFSNYGAATTEDGDAITVPVYRLGGTKGRAVAYVVYNPSVNLIGEDKYGYASALSTDDIELEVEDPSPVAQYQPLGKDPDPEVGEYQLRSDFKDDSYIFSLSGNAEAYKWQSKSDGDWTDIFDETNDTLSVTAEDYQKCDVRCVYTVGGTSYCTASAKGEKYEKPEPETLPQMPEDIDLSPVSTYTKLEPEKDDAFKAYMFPVTFADGEWVKNIIVTPIEDKLSECSEAASLIIQDCDGGCINKSFNSTTVTVEDNDAAEPFTLGLTERSVTADKADGSVTLTVRRNGGFQEMVTIDYETVDGSAFAGKDYTAANGTFAFAGDINELSIEIPLLDDGVKNNTPKTFTFRLKDLKGDKDNICTLKTTEVTVGLINSGTATKTNLATKLTDTNAIGLTSDGKTPDSAVDIDPDTVTGTQVKEEPAYATVKKVKTSQGMHKSYRYKNVLEFPVSNGGGFWENDYFPLKDNKRFIDSSGEEPDTAVYDTANGTAKLHSKFRGWYAFQIPFMTRMYRTISVHCDYDQSRDPDYFEIGYGRMGSYTIRGQAAKSGDSTLDIYWAPPDSVEAHAAYCDAFQYFTADKIIYDEQGTPWESYDGDKAPEVTLSNLKFGDRVVFDKPIALMVHTANDGVSSEDGSVVTAPPDAAAITDSDLYDDLKPEISIVPGKGGTDKEGRLYAGSQLEISFDKEQFDTYVKEYQIWYDHITEVGIYLTDPNGRIVKRAEKNENGSYYLTMVWEDNQTEDFSGQYTINVVMEREQGFAIDITPSVPRLEGTDSPNPEKAGDAYEEFWSSMDKTQYSWDPSIEFGYSARSDTAPYYEPKTEVVELFRYIGHGDEPYTLKQDESNGQVLITLQEGLPNNIQWVNFHRRHEDIILFNGRMFAGDDRIVLEPDDFSQANLEFLYYSAEYADVPTKMITSVDHVDLYADNNHNHKIDGVQYDDGFFRLDKDSGDEFIMSIQPDSGFDEKAFDYIKNADGSYSELFFKVFYRMTPRKLHATPEEKNDRAQVMPAVVTTVTDPEKVFGLTNEQKNYRYLICGMTNDENGNTFYSSDNHLMYEQEAYKMQCVDVPLGGDQNPATSYKDDKGDIHYKWEPEYHGNLLFPYDSPSPIYLDNTPAGNDLPLAPDYNSTGTLSEKDIENLNGYLGSFVGSTRVTLCSFEQQRTMEEIMSSRDSGKKKAAKRDADPAGNTEATEGDQSSGDAPSDTSLIGNPDCSTQVRVESVPDQRGNTDGDTGSEFEDNQANTLMDGLNMTYNSTLPKIKFGVFGVVNVTTDYFNTILTVNIPIGELQAAPFDTDDQTEENPPGGEGGEGGEGAAGGEEAEGGEGAEGAAQPSDSGKVWKYKNDAAKRYRAVKDLIKNDSLVEALKDPSYESRVRKNNPKFTFFAVSVSANIAYAFEFKYDPSKNETVFQHFTFALYVTIQVSLTIRPLPLVYICISAGVTIGFGTGIYRKEYYVMDKDPVFNDTDHTDGTTVKKGEFLKDPKTGKDCFPINYKALNMKFKGTVGIKLYEDEACTKPVEHASTGYLKSDSDTAMQANLLQQEDYKFKDGKTYYLKILAQDDAVAVKSIQEINDKAVTMFFDGFTFSVSPFANLSLGFGAGVLKAELCFNFTYTFSYNFDREGTDTEDGSGQRDIKEVKSGLLAFSASINIQLILFSFTFEMFTISKAYDNASHSWKDAEWVSTGESKAKSGARRGSKVNYDAVMSLPQDTSDTQKIYQTQKKENSSGWLKAYKPEDVSVPFEQSGLYSSSDAVRLLDGVDTGYDYRVVTAKNADGKDVSYVVYHISRDTADSTLDQSMLVMSELVMTGDNKGLQNPVDPKSDTPYIVVDVNKDGKPDEAGDLDFSVDTADDGSLRVVWVSYDKVAEASAGATTQTLSDAAKNTVVKTSTFTAGGSGFAGYTVISNGSGAKAEDEPDRCVLMPDISGDAAAFVRSNHITDEELDRRTSLYEEYLRTRGYDVSSTDPSSDATAKKKYAISRVATQRGIWTTMGGSSDICVRIGDSDVCALPMDDGVTVDSIKIQKIGDLYYVAYTTNEDCWTDAEGNVTENAEEIRNLLTVKRLYLRTCSLKKGDDGKDTVEWGMDGKAILLRTLYDYDNNDTLKDGIYADGEVQSKDNPYFDNLQFLNAKLGDSLSGEEETFPLRKGESAEDFLLFDMCGSTYIIRRSSLQAMTGSSIATDDSGTSTTKGTIIPFFTPDISKTTDGGATASSGRCNTTIGADGDGNLVAVYVTGVPNTGNTALCLSKYDPETGWGDQTLLAMNYLSVYEENQQYSRSDEDAAKAFYGLLEDQEDDTEKGGLNEFRFSHPQIALGKETVVSDDGEVTQNPTLMILTQGTMQYLKENTDEDTKEITPYLPADTDEVLANPDRFERSKDVPPGAGIYAIEYGSGRQAVGNVNINMPIEDFSRGATPDVTVSFENTGDVAIRGSKDQPITVSLVTSSDSSSELAKWEITENVIAGQQVYLSGTLELTETLPVGTKIYLSVGEDTYYESQGGTPFSAVSDAVIEIEEYPELAIRDESVKFDIVHDDGDTLVDVDFHADNRGTADAGQVYAVFSYDTGTIDKNGNEIYAPLDLSDSELSVNGEKATGGNLKNGRLDIGDIAVDQEMSVSGKLKVPSSCFNEKATGALALKIELFSNGDEGLSDGKHNEYNSVNNVLIKNVEHRTVFAAPVNIEVPRGNELHIPISCQYTNSDETPHIMVAEFPDKDGDLHFGAHSFRYGEFKDGSGTGMLELKAESEGSGFIRIKDVSTNSFFDIAYNITPQTDGINIEYSDDGVFRFYNKDGTEFDKYGYNQSWRFRDNYSLWGGDGTEPYLKDVAMGQVNSDDPQSGSYFEFDTDAESIDLIFQGTVRVESTFEGFEPVVVSASGGDGKEDGEYATIVFGSNPDELVHTVKITVLDGIDDPTPHTDLVKYKYALFDRIIEHYNPYTLPVPDEDHNAPTIMFSRSLPKAGSIASETADGKKNSITIKTYIFDETGIASVTFNGKAASSVKKDDVKFWTASLKFSKNGHYTVTVMDDYGNKADYKVNVNWFSDDAADETSAVPTVSAGLIKRGTDGKEDVRIISATPFTDDDYAYIEPAGTATDGSSEPEFSVTEVTVTQKKGLISGPIEADEDDHYPALSNGWYIVRATDPGSNGERWSTAVVEMMRLSQNQLYIAADDQKKDPTEPEPELTYKVAGLLPGDQLSGALAREPGDKDGTYAISQGTLAPGYEDAYNIRFTGADFVIGHEYGKPVWNWVCGWDVVTLDMSGGAVIDIYPTYYTVNGGEQIEKDCASTKYVLTGKDTGSAAKKLNLHGGSAAAYHLSFDDLNIHEKNDDFITVNGENVTVDLTLDNATIQTVEHHVFSSDANDTVMSIGVKGQSFASFIALNSVIADNKITINKAGDLSLLVINDIGQLGSSERAMIFSPVNNPDPFEVPYSATATFVCAACHDIETVHAAVVQEEKDGMTVHTATVQFKGATYTDVMDSCFTGHSLSLNGSIGVNYYLNLTDRDIRDGAIVDFRWTVNGQEKSRCVKLTANNMTAQGYKVSCPIAAAEMTYDITATLTIGGKTVKTDTYSAVDYAHRLLSDEYRTIYLADHSEEELAKLTTLIKTMLSYGAKAQICFDRDKDNLADKDIDYTPAEVTAQTIGDTGASDMTADLEKYGLAYRGSTIVYLAGTAMRHYYEITDPQAFEKVKNSVTFDDKPVGYGEKDGLIYFELKSIAADELDQLYTIAIGENKYQYSVLDCCKVYLSFDIVSDAVKALAAATFLYNQAADAYFGR